MIFYSTGCASYVPGTMPSYDIPPGHSEKTPQVLTINSEVIIHLTSGEKIKGIILDVTPDQILLNQNLASGFKKVVYLKTDIRQIMVKEIGGPSTEAQLAKGAAIAVGVVLAGLVGFYFAMSNAFGDGY